MANEKKSTKQTELLLVMVLSIVLGLGGGYVLGANTGSDGDESTAATETMKEETAHSHSDMFAVPAEQAPTLEIMVTEDAKSGYNVKLMTENFTFTPDKVNGENVIGEGHAHLYVDGEKIGRLYGPDFHYDESFEGTKTFRVTLNANDHSEYAVGDAVIEAEVEVTHDSSDPAHDDMHEHSAYDTH